MLSALLVFVGKEKLSSALLGSVIGDMQIKLTKDRFAGEKTNLIMQVRDIREKWDSGCYNLGLTFHLIRERGGGEGHLAKNS